MRKFSVVTLEQAGSVLVTGKADRLVGIFTGRDAVCRVLAQRRNPSGTHLADVMTPNPITMSPDQTALEALRLMSKGGFRHVPLVKNGRILGIVSRGDFTGLEQNTDDQECELRQHMG